MTDMPLYAREEHEVTMDQAVIENEILERLSQGETLRAICRSAHMPSERQARRWAAGLAGHEDFARRVRDAREAGAWSLAESIIDECNGCSPEMVQVARLKVDSIKWLVGKVFPAVFGDRAPAATVAPAVAEHPAPPPVAPSAEEWSAWARAHIDATDAKPPGN